MRIANKIGNGTKIGLMVGLISLILVRVSAIEPADFVDGFGRSLDELRDYQVRIVTRAIDAGVEEYSIVDLYYSQRGNIRVDVRESSRNGDEGSVAILDENGTVTVRTGSRFLPITLRYTKDHPRVTSIRSRRIDEGMVTVVLADLSEAFASQSAVITEIPEGYKIVMRGENGGIRKSEILRIDRRYRPFSHETLENGRLVESVVWLHYTPNLGLPAKMFDVRFRKTEVERLPISTLARLPVGSVEREALSRLD